MYLNRRQFAQTLGASALLLPFMRLTPAHAAAAPTGVKRFIFITSLGIGFKDWLPTSAAGAPVALSAYNIGLQPVLDDIMLVGGLSGCCPSENHGTSQHTTALGFGDGNKSSIESFIANQLSPGTPLPLMLLGADAKNASSFYSNGQQQPTTDSPLDAFNLAFTNGSSGSSSTASFPRKSILDTILGQIKSLQTTLGPTQKAKLDEHLTGIEALEKQLSMASACKTATPPNPMGQDPSSDAATAPLGQLQYQLIPQLFGCGITNIIGFQWGITNKQVIDVNNVEGKSSDDEHNAGHSGNTVEVSAAEYFLCQNFSNLVTSLKGTSDPTTPGKSLLDTTLICWTRDIGNAWVHTQESVPYVLAGGTSYLKYNKGGTYHDLSNQGSTRRILLNCIEAMNASPAGFGSRSGAPNTADFQNPNGGNPVNNTPVAAIKA